VLSPVRWKKNDRPPQRPLDVAMEHLAELSVVPVAAKPLAVVGVWRRALPANNIAWAFH
jgi:hypothetical protein